MSRDDIEKGAAPELFVIDDEPMMGTTLELTLEGEYRVRVFLSAEEALRELEAGAPVDVILCDLMMPSLSGMRFHEQLARVRPELRRRVLYMSGGAYTPEARDFLEKSGAPNIGKPFDFDKLIEMLDELRRASS